MIRIDLNSVNQNVTELYITVNIYTDHASFKDIRDSYVRICLPKPGKGRFVAGHELAEYPLDGNLFTRGLVFGRLVRHGARWSFDALAWGC